MQSKLKFVRLVVIVLFLFKTAGAQQKTIDSIQQLLNKEKSGTQRINLILQLANIHRFSNTDTSNLLSASALLRVDLNQHLFNFNA